MKKTKLAIFCTLLGVLLVLYAVWEIDRVPSLLQYIAPAETETPVTGGQTDSEQQSASRLTAAIKALEDQQEKLAAVVQASTLTGASSQVSVAAEHTQVGAGLLAIDAQYPLVYPQLPLQGRLFLPEETELGLPVALIDEQLAIALFQMTEVIDRELTVGGATYRVVGVLRHEKRIGDDYDHYLYLPLQALAKAHSQVQTVCLTAVPQAGSGAMATFTEVAQGILPGGNAYNLNREKTGANIWARFMAVGVGFALLGLLISRFVQTVINLSATMKERLRQSYLSQLLLFLLLRIFLLLLWLAAMTLAAKWLAELLLAPINLFPEYVPAILVEPREIDRTFWNLRRAEAAAVVLRTPAVIRLLYFGGLCKTGGLVILAGLAQFFAKRARARAD